MELKYYITVGWIVSRHVSKELFHLFFLQTCSLIPTLPLFYCELLLHKSCKLFTLVVLYEHFIVDWLKWMKWWVIYWRFNPSSTASSTWCAPAFTEFCLLAGTRCTVTAGLSTNIHFPSSVVLEMILTGKVVALAAGCLSKVTSL